MTANGICGCGCGQPTRVGTPNACSFLYGRAQRALTALGYDHARTKTYTREDESGASLRAAGFVQEAILPARSYAKSNVKRHRSDRSTPVPRVRWGVAAALSEGESDEVSAA